MDPRENDDIRVGFRSAACQFQAVADKVREILNLRFLVIMSKKNRVELLFQAKNFRFELERDLGFR